MQNHDLQLLCGDGHDHNLYFLQLNKSLGELNHWRSKFEREAMSRIEELEATKIKLQVSIL